MIRIIIIVVLILILGFVIYWFGGFRVKSCSKQPYPGVGGKCKCDQTGDDTSKFYGDNWRARGAVCDGLYIPKDIDLGAHDPIKVLELMGNMYAGNKNLANNMHQLAITSMAVSGKG